MTGAKNRSTLTGCSCNTVNKYLHKFIAKQLTYTKVDQMSDLELDQVFLSFKNTDLRGIFEQLLPPPDIGTGESDKA